LRPAPLDDLESKRATQLNLRLDLRIVLPTTESYIRGFRVASISEPSGLVLAALGLIGLAIGRQRKRCS
jgi:hypothetical protein